MYKLPLFFTGLYLLFSCTPKDKATGNANSTTMDSVAIEKHIERIKGPAGSLYINDGGTGGITVLFTHSFGGDNQHWKNQLEHLRKTRRAIAFDFRGHGKSDAPVDNDYSAEAMAQDIAAVADSLELDRFILVGHSMGGSAAIIYAGTHPERLAGLILEGTPGKTDAKQARMVITSLESDHYQKVMDDYMRQLVNGAKPEVDSIVNKGVHQLSKASSIAMIKALFEFDPLPELKKYNGPRLIIATQREEEQPNSLQKQAPEIPRKTVEGTSHWIQLDKPDEFNALLDEFIKSIESKLTL